MLGVRSVGHVFMLCRHDDGRTPGRQRADDRLMAVQACFRQTRVDEGRHEIAHAILRDGEGLLDLERAQRPKAGEQPVQQRGARG